MYLLDTNVVSELRRPRPDAAVVEWVAGTPDRQFLSVVVIGELTRGVELLRRTDLDRGRPWPSGSRHSYTTSPTASCP